MNKRERGELSTSGPFNTRMPTFHPLCRSLTGGGASTGQSVARQTGREATDGPDGLCLSGR